MWPRKDVDVGEVLFAGRVSEADVNSFVGVVDVFFGEEEAQPLEVFDLHLTSLFAAL
jgi:hypothetical protein